MSIFPDNEDAELKRLSFKFKNINVKVRILEDIPQLFLEGKSIGPLKKDDILELRLWQAIPLIEEGKAKLEEFPIKVSYTDIHKFVWKETQTPEIQELKNISYIGLKQREKLMKMSSNDIEKFKTALRDLITVRTRKIIKLSMQDSELISSLKPLLPEEKLLYENLSKILSIWKRRMLEGEEYD